MTNSVTNRVWISSYTFEINSTTLHEEAIVRVQRPWITLPVILAFSTTAPLQTTIIVTRQDTDILWKPSSLSRLFHGLAG